MRVFACFALTASLFGGGGCGIVTPDPCKNVAGTCVSLTVQSSTVTAVDSLHILASGALTGDQTSSGGRANLPIVVALKLPGGVAGQLDLHVDGVLGTLIAGSCDTSAVVTEGQHTNAVCTLVGRDNGNVDLSMVGDDLPITPPDMVVVACDPKGVTGPQCQWRWQTPLPQGDDIVSVVAFGDADTFAITVGGSVLHRDATAWSPLSAQLALISATSLFAGASNSRDLYAAGNDTA